VLALAASVAVAAQSTAPDAGTTLSDLAPTTQLPVASPTIGLQGNTVTQAASGGAMIVVQQNRNTLSFFCGRENLQSLCSIYCTMKQCPVCSEKFADKGLLRNHVQRAHPDRFRTLYGMPSGNKGRGNRTANNQTRPVLGGGKGTRGVGPTGGARTSQTGTIRLTGTDRVGSLTFTQAQVVAGATLLDMKVSCALGVRLPAVARAFERVRYHSLKLRVVPRSGITSSGGYIAAFLADPEDDQFDVSKLVATDGAQEGRFSETRTVVAKIPDTLFFTTEERVPRLSSPGRFVVLVDSPSDADVPFIIDLEWDVSLSIPYIERPKLLTTVTLIADAWAKDDRNYFCTQEDGTRWAPSDLFGPEGRKLGYASILRCQQGASVVFREGVGDISTKTYFYFYVGSNNEPSGVYFLNHEGASPNDSEKWLTEVPPRILIPKGTVFEVLVLRPVV
jgi:hypothetical protein